MQAVQHRGPDTDIQGQTSNHEPLQPKILQQIVQTGLVKGRVLVLIKFDSLGDQDAVLRQV
ncbi:MAG: hypothetical protein ACLFM3_01160 [Desulfohalobiaceae bacterium]